MDIKLEVEALWNVGVGMDDCCRVLNEVYSDLNTIHIDFWQGNARTAFDQVLKEMPDQALSCASRLGQSTSVIVEALKKYNEIEIDNVKASTSLPADDIF